MNAPAPKEAAQTSAQELPCDAVPEVTSELASKPAPSKPIQLHNPLHGLTLEAIVTALAEHYGWEGLALRIPVRCFALDPSVASSLKFLRKTPWAREKVEGLYLFMLREERRSGLVRPK